MRSRLTTNAGHPFLAHMLSQQLWSVVCGPLLLGPLLQPPQSPDASSQKGTTGGIPQPACALFVLERLFILLEYKPLVNNIALALFGRESKAAGACAGISPGAAYDVAAAMTASSSSCPSMGRISPLVSDLYEESGQPRHPLDPYCSGARFSTCREALIAILRGAATSDGGTRADQLAASGAVRMLVAATRCESVWGMVLEGGPVDLAVRFSTLASGLGRFWDVDSMCVCACVYDRSSGLSLVSGAPRSPLSSFTPSVCSPARDPRRSLRPLASGRRRWGRALSAHWPRPSTPSGTHLCLRMTAAPPRIKRPPRWSSDRRERERSWRLERGLGQPRPRLPQRL